MSGHVWTRLASTLLGLSEPLPSLLCGLCELPCEGIKQCAASFVDVLDQLSQLYPPGARHHVVNVLVTALAKLAAQLVADLLIAAGPSTAALLIGHLLRAHAHAQYLLDLEARRRLSLWRTRRNDWQRRSSSSTRSCVRILALRGRAAKAVCARTRQSMLTIAVRAGRSHRLHGMHARHDGAPVWGPRVTLLLRGPR